MIIFRLSFYISIFLLTIVFLHCNNKQENTEAVVEKPEVKINAPKTTTNSEEKYILFFGNSLTAGYGLEEQFAFPSLIQNRLDSLKLSYTVVNAGLSGETSAGGLGRIDWILKQPIDLFFLELGANDALRGLNLNETEINLREIIRRVKSKYDIPIIIAGMEAPPNMGADYTNQFRSIFNKLADEFDSALIPFLLEGVAGIKSLNNADGIHPNEKGQKIVMENVWKVLSDYLD